MIHLELVDFLGPEIVQIHTGSPDHVLNEVKGKYAAKSEFAKNQNVTDWGHVVISRLPLPQYWLDFFAINGIPEGSALHTLFALEFGNLGQPAVSINRLVINGKTLTGDDLLAIQFGKGDVSKGHQELREIREIGLLIWS